ncbi:MAG: aldehyde dehydrogenase family protein, partial [Candidatus Hydrogenedentota bacterium]
MAKKSVKKATRKQSKKNLKKDSGKFAVVSPLDKMEIAEYPEHSKTYVEQRMLALKAASKSFEKLGIKKRIQILKNIRKDFIEESENLVERVHAETGKPTAEIYSGEIVANIELLDFYIQYGPKYLKPESVPINPINYPGKKGKIHHRPLGVVAVLSSWNYPIALAMRAIVPALLAGNCVAFKPSAFASYSGELLADIFKRNLPTDCFEVFFGNKETNQAVALNSDKVNFIGSVATGKALSELCGKHLIPISTELSGKDAAIVLPDANLERAVQGILWGAFTNSGQNCASVERIFLHQEIADSFLEKFVDKASKLRIEQDIGPLKNEKQMKLVESHVKEAKKHRGVKILCGGNRIPGSLYYEPTVILADKPDYVFMQEETFGPTVAVYIVDSFEEAISLTNDCDFGLTVSVWTAKPGIVQEVADEFETGVVTINNCVFTGALPGAPWGGVKHTGHGVTNSKYGLLEMTRPQFVLLDKSRSEKEPWWYPYNKELLQLMQDVIRFSA